MVRTELEKMQFQVIDEINHILLNEKGFTYGKVTPIYNEEKEKTHNLLSFSTPYIGKSNWIKVILSVDLMESIIVEVEYQIKFECVKENMTIDQLIKFINELDLNK